MSRGGGSPQNPMRRGEGAPERLEEDVSPFASATQEAGEIGLAHCRKVRHLVALYSKRNTEGMQAAHVMTTTAEEGRNL